MQDLNSKVKVEFGVDNENLAEGAINIKINASTGANGANEVCIAKVFWVLHICNVIINNEIFYALHINLGVTV